MMNSLFKDFEKITWDKLKQATDMAGIINLFYFIYEAWEHINCLFVSYDDAKKSLALISEYHRLRNNGTLTAANSNTKFT